MRSAGRIDKVGRVAYIPIFYWLNLKKEYNMSDSDFTLALTAILLFGTFAGMIVYVIYIYTYDIIVKYKNKGYVQKQIQEP